MRVFNNNEDLFQYASQQQQAHIDRANKWSRRVEFFRQGMTPSEVAKATGVSGVNKTDAAMLAREERAIAAAYADMMSAIVDVLIPVSANDEGVAFGGSK